MVLLELENCPVCETELEEVEEAPLKVQQVAEIVEQPVEIREYRRPFYQCPNCGWSGYSPMPLGVKEGFSYGGRLCSIVGWLGYGGNLTWRKQEYFVFTDSSQCPPELPCWGAQLVAQMFSFLETMRLQGDDAIAPHKGRFFTKR